MIIKNTKDLLNILTVIKFCDVDEIEKVKAIDLAIEIIKDWYDMKATGTVSEKISEHLWRENENKKLADS